MASNINDMNDNQLIGRLLDGRYQVLESIGYGAFADVYLVKFNNTELVFHQDAYFQDIYRKVIFCVLDMQQSY